jgi:hypothetical protein
VINSKLRAKAKLTVLLENSGGRLPLIAETATFRFKRSGKKCDLTRYVPYSPWHWAIFGV